MTRSALPTRLLVAAATAALAILDPGSAGAQINPLRDCTRQIARAGLTTRLVVGFDTTFQFRSGFSLSCPPERKNVTADSADFDQSRGILHLMGRVHYTEPDVDIRSREMFYYRRDDRIDASGNVRAQMAAGSAMTGESVIYMAKNLALGRPFETMQATRRPHFVFVEVDSATGAADTTNVDAQTVYSHGTEIHASGNVIIDRSDMTATGDSVYVRNVPADRLMRIMRSPTLKGRVKHPSQWSALSLTCRPRAAM